MDSREHESADAGTLADEFAGHMRELVRVSLAHAGAEDPRDAFRTPEVMAFVDWAYASRDRVEAALRQVSAPAQEMSTGCVPHEAPGSHERQPSATVLPDGDPSREAASLSEAEFLDELQRQCDQAGSISAWARQHYFSSHYVGKVLLKRRPVGRDIALLAGYEPIPTYQLRTPTARSIPVTPRSAPQSVEAPETARAMLREALGITGENRDGQ